MLFDYVIIYNAGCEKHLFQADCSYSAIRYAKKYVAEHRIKYFNLFDRSLTVLLSDC